MAGITTYLSILTLNINGLNSPIKRHRMANWNKKEKLIICCLQEIHLIDRNYIGLGWKLEDLPSKWPPKQAGVTILLSEKVNFKLTLLKQDNEGYLILIKGAIHQKEIIVINLYAPNFIKHTLKDLKAHIDSNTVVVGDFNTPLSPIDKWGKYLLVIHQTKDW
jgi:exonuclease III